MSDELDELMRALYADLDRQRSEELWSVDEQPDDPLAPPGWLWVCAACGKTAQHRFGGDSDYGWDESCMLNAILTSPEELERLEQWREGCM